MTTHIQDFLSVIIIHSVGELTGLTTILFIRLGTGIIHIHGMVVPILAIHSGLLRIFTAHTGIGLIRESILLPMEMLAIGFEAQVRLVQELSVLRGQPVDIQQQIVMR